MTYKLVHRLIVLNFLYTYELIQGYTWPSKAKKMLIFRFVGIFEYIILLMLILFLDIGSDAKSVNVSGPQK